MRGRPTKFNPALAEKVLQYVRSGAYIETAAAASGINKATLFRWLREGAKGKNKALSEFNAAVEKALGEAELRDLLIIGKAATGGEVIADVTVTKPDGTTVRDRKLSVPQWQAAAWRLERKFPDRYGITRRIQAEVEREVEALLERIKEALTDVEFAKVLAAIGVREGGPGPAGEAQGESPGGRGA